MKKKTYRLRTTQGKILMNVKASRADVAAKRMKMKKPSLKVLVITTKSPKTKKTSVFIFSADFKGTGKKKTPVVNKQAFWYNE